MANIAWQKETDIGGLDGLSAWADVMNVHVDEMITDHKECLMYASKKFHRDWTKLSDMVIYDKINDVVYQIYDKDGAQLIGSDDAHKLQTYAFRQFDRLLAKLTTK